MAELNLALSHVIKKNLERGVSDLPLDYFSWGRDDRHVVDNTERLPDAPTIKRLLLTSIKSGIYSIVGGFDALGIIEKKALSRYRKKYQGFSNSYALMSDDYSRNVFAELIALQLLTEKRIRLSAFDQDFIESYERSSALILSSKDTLPVYRWILRKVDLDSPRISFYTVPTILNLHFSGRLYRYESADVVIEVEGGDSIIDAGVGWGDTTIYLAALASQKPGGHLYAFDILEEGFAALSEQCRLNPDIRIIDKVLRALSSHDGNQVNITMPSPGARISDEPTGSSIETITIDTFVDSKNLAKIDFIKMDIEGAEVPALRGASRTIEKFKPKLAISAYHKWDDLLVIPQLIHEIRDDYSYYLDCTTGFGGEAILYCK